MKQEIKDRMEARMQELQNLGKDIDVTRIQSLGCCGRADGSYRCSSK